MFNAILAWLKNEKVFLKVQSGTGDNLQDEDIQKGFVDYCLWSTFKPKCIDIDGELNMECLDSGMVLLKEYADAITALQPWLGPHQSPWVIIGNDCLHRHVFRYLLCENSDVDSIMPY